MTGFRYCLQRVFHAQTMFFMMLAFAVGADENATRQGERSRPATLSLEEILLGMDAHAAKVNDMPFWELIYDHERHYTNPLPQYAGYYPKLRITNAKSRDKLFLKKEYYDKQATVTAIWADGVSVVHEGRVRTITPDLYVSFVEFFLITDAMFIDIYDKLEFKSPTMRQMLGTASPSEAKFFLLPREIRYDLAHYRIRPNLETIDGHECHVLEYPGKDVVWVDAGSDYIVLQRHNFQSPTTLLYSIQNLGYTEYRPGFWIPAKTIKRIYLSIYDDSDAKGQEHNDEVNTLVSVNTSGERTMQSYFMPPKLNVRDMVDDQVRGMSYRIQPDGVKHFDDAASRIDKTMRICVRRTGAKYLKGAFVGAVLVGNVLLVIRRQRQSTGSWHATA
ncbi:hypothetical protein SAMN05444166_2325 [Singulisphaera sp. GP187]|uniref:hypothetical protein n=1 Tax=Singulisphaera sp. GP187 TaxID=1882752 RepID=UPI00092A21D8|nr:hypothetical protein [Singulisphaera sp. GP187]SIO07618.1 hypothetical protein SAMN05444166_2325 [Singulisphaera sp. GP187]